MIFFFQEGMTRFGVFYLQCRHMISNTFLRLQHIVLQKCNGQVGMGKNLITLEKKDKIDLMVKLSSMF